MTTREREVLQRAESLVRDVLQKDFNQKANKALVREVARKVSKVVPREDTKSDPRTTA